MSEKAQKYIEKTPIESLIDILDRDVLDDESLATKIVEATKKFNEELERCSLVDTTILRRKITV